MRWKDEPCFVLGSGPSLTKEDCEAIRGYRIIAVNLTYQLAPFADICFGLDKKFWEQIYPGDFAGECWTTSRCKAKKSYLHRVAVQDGSGVAEGMVGRFAGSGGTALNLAYVFGANPIILLGFDMQRLDGKSRWCGAYKGEGGKEFGDKSFPLTNWIRQMEQASEYMRSRGVEVINCTRQTAIRKIPWMSLDEYLIWDRTRSPRP